MQRTRTSLIAILLLSITGLCLAAPPLEPEPGVYPIGCFPGPFPDLNTRENWQTVKDANFTMVCPVHRYQVADELIMLDHCQEVGLKAVANVKILPPVATDPIPEGWQARVTECVETFADHPAFFGYMLRDEPGVDRFGQIDQLTTEFRRHDTRHMTCVNLFPTYASAEQLGVPTYKEYLDQYMRIVRPDFLCYDHYALNKNGTDTPDYFLNHELAMDASRQFDTPCWIVLLSSWHTYFRVPNEAEMRWQVYTSLAYGVKGIFYFTYWPFREDWTCIVDSQGKPGPLYPIIRQLNSEILNLGTTLLDLDPTVVYHTGEEIPDGCTRLPSGLPVSVPNDKPVVIGFFKEPEASQGESAPAPNWVMLVNRDYNEPLTLTVNLAADVTSVSRVSEATGELERLASDNQSLVLELPPGGGSLLRLK